MNLIKAIQEGQEHEGVQLTPSIRDKAMSHLLNELSSTNNSIAMYKKENDAWSMTLLDSCIKDKEIFEYLIKKI